MLKIELESKTQSCKVYKIGHYNIMFKLSVISYAELHDNNAAGRKYNVDNKHGRERWKERFGEKPKVS